MLERRYLSYQRSDCSRLFLIAFFWDGLDWAYHKKDTLPGEISLPENNGSLYAVTMDGPTSSHRSLGVKVALAVGQVAEPEVVKDALELFAAQIQTAQCKILLV